MELFIIFERFSLKNKTKIDSTDKKKHCIDWVTVVVSVHSELIETELKEFVH